MTEQLIEGINSVTKAVPSKDSHVVVRSNGTKLYVGGYSPEGTAVYTAEGEFPEFDTLALGPSVADKLSKVSPDSVIDVGSKDIAIKDGKRSLTFALSDMKGIPNISALASKYSDDNSISLDPTEVHRLFSAVNHASNDQSVGDTRFHGFHVTNLGNALEVMATNGNIMSLCISSRSEDKLDSPETFLVGPEYIAVVNVMSKAKEFRISVSKNGTLSSTGEFDGYVLRTVSSLVKGAPLPYKNVLEGAMKSSKGTFSFNRSDMASAVSDLMFFADEDDYNKTYVTIENGAMKFSTSNTYGKGEAEVKLEALGGTPGTWNIMLDLSLLSKFIRSVKYDTLTLSLGDNTSPLMFSAGDLTEMIVVRIR